MRRIRVPAGMVAVVATIIFASAVVAQSSPNFDLSHSVLASGGGERQSANFLIQDSSGQMAAGVSGGANYEIEAGFEGNDFVAGAAGGDGFEVDDTCGQATLIDTLGSAQSHNFHYLGDRDWLRFGAQANRTYIVEVNNTGAKADAVIELQDDCVAPPATQSNNAFGTTVQLQWNATKNGDYFVKLQQFDPAFFGDGADYIVSVKTDNVPPSTPSDPRCFSINNTTLGMQWQRSPQFDVTRYQVRYTKPGDIEDRIKDVVGASSTFVELDQLSPNVLYSLRVYALDFSGNISPASGTVQCVTTTPPDTTQPTLSLQQPSGGTFYTTTANLLTFTGQAQDPGNNLSRVNVKNTTRNVEGWDFGLSGAADDFRVESLTLGVGDNSVQVTVFDDAGNTSQRSVTVRRLGDVAGAALIVAGHNETFGLQTNIYNAANRAFRIFQSAGFGDDRIYYIAPTNQDANGDGSNDVDAPSSPAAIQNAITAWAAQGGRVGPGKPLFVYFVDHGFEEKFCATGCNDASAVTPQQLNQWLDALEQATGADQVTVIFEACRSGSFIDKKGDPTTGLGRQGRVIISSTGADNNAYASAQGAYFSDAFFSCAADSNNLKVCFEQGVSAVQATGVNQTPWLDDNGDGVFNEGDGVLAEQRHMTSFFSSIRPVISGFSTERQGPNGTLAATVIEGAEAIGIVWATVYPPSFQEPTDVTLNLNVPTVRLEPVPNVEGRYTFDYTNGFLEEGDYRIIVYAQDRLGIHAVPKREGETSSIYLPVVGKN